MYRITNRQQVQLDELKAHHLYGCSPIDWLKESVEPFPKYRLGPAEEVWADKEDRYQPSHFSKKIGFSKIVTYYYKYQRNKGRTVDQRIYEKWEERYPFVKKVLEGDPQAWRMAVKKYGQFHRNPSLAKAYSLYVYSNIVECDVYLHTLENVIPYQIEKVTKRGNLRYHIFPKMKRIELYEMYVYSCLNKVIIDLLAVLPCHTIFINGVYGDGYDVEPIISSVIERKKFQQYRCPKRTLQRHRLLVTFKKRSGFCVLNRVYSPRILYDKEDC
ncbi:hypothetical protein [Bacillus sp. FJAT-27225]|uniref:hypothetical protein n=1 Tax=Bacillus sp. FJAT-27225 TaxID=1743144 RepID=UPI0011125551|nr:hypothetical protein [Bacillus sp. FJAT-27225]